MTVSFSANAAKAGSRQRHRFAAGELERRILCVDRFDGANRRALQADDCRAGDQRRISGRRALFNLGVQLRLRHAEQQLAIIRGEAGFRQQDLLLIGPDHDVVALQRGDGADLPALGVGNLHADGDRRRSLGKSGGHWGRSQEGNANELCNNLVHHVLSH